MKNRAHAESMQKRIDRFKNLPPEEVIDSLLNSLDNFFNNEIKLTTEGNNHQTSLMFLGTHAVALTISKGLFDKGGFTGYSFFLKNFIDGETADTRFSSIANLIHGWRNVLAHQWLSLIGHRIGYDYNMQHGWQLRNGIFFINPKIYCDHYLRSFSAKGKIRKYRQLLNDEKMQEAKDRLIGKYLDDSLEKMC